MSGVAWKDTHDTECDHKIAVLVLFRLVMQRHYHILDILIPEMELITVEYLNSLHYLG